MTKAAGSIYRVKHEIPIVLAIRLYLKKGIAKVIFAQTIHTSEHHRSIQIKLHKYHTHIQNEVYELRVI